MIMKPVIVEIVTRVMTSFGHCRHCDVVFHQTGLDQVLHQREINDYPADLREEFANLSAWIRELNRLYKHRLRIRLIDAQSLSGLYKSLRHRIRKYPTFIVEGKETYSGWDKERLEGLLDKYIRGALAQKASAVVVGKARS
jgi:hypothetical protein